MFVKPFRYARAASVAEACDLLRRHGEGAKVLAGGQSLLPMINSGLVDADILVDISRIPEICGVEQAPGYLVFGASTRHAYLASDPEIRRAQPLLAEAARLIGNPRVRNRGTLGGSLAHADPAAELPLVLTALGATVEVTDGVRARELRAEDFAVSILSTQLRADELVTRVQVPVLGTGWGWSFKELSRRLGDFAIVAVAVALSVRNGQVLEARVAAAGVSERPVRLGAVEAALSGASRDEFGARVGLVREVDPPGDATGTSEYRRHLLTVLVRRALDEAFVRSEAEWPSG
jgi:carbon-monoxide dehydrogenase medium subunit